MKNIILLFKKILGKKIVNKLYIYKQFYFFKPWKTKPLEFWTLLNLILLKTKPSSILELGSGKSTYFLYEYASQNNINLQSIEHNKSYFNYLSKILNSFFGKNLNYLKFVPIIGDWYDINKINNKFDFLFIDGPNIISKNKIQKSVRNSSKAINFFRNIINQCKIIIIDDTHRTGVMDLIDKMSIKDKFVEFYYSNSTNKIRVYYKNEYEEYILKISNEIKVLSDKTVFNKITN